MAAIGVDYGQYAAKALTGGGGSSMPKPSPEALAALTGQAPGGMKQYSSAAEAAAAARAGAAGSGGGGSSAGSGGSGGPGLINTSAPTNPQIKTIQDSQLQAYQGDMGAARASQIAAGSIRDAAEGELKAMRGSTTRRGVSGAGLEGNLEADIRGKTVRNIAGSSTSIAQDAEARRQALGSTIAGQAATAERLLGEQQDRAIRQAEAESNIRLNEQRAQQQKLEDQIKLFSELSDLSALDPVSGYGGYGGYGTGLF